MNVRSLKALQQLTAISNRDWTIDWQTLSALDLRALESTTKWTSMVRMVAHHRVGFTLAPFSAEPDLSITDASLRLVPIPNIKLALQGSRHLIVSRRHPDGLSIFMGLERGLAILKQRGDIRRAYEECGFINRRTRDWALIVPTP